MIDASVQPHQPLPLIVGVTGHRHVLAEAVPILEQAIADFFQQLQARYANCPMIVLSSLADGADRLCARAALDTGCELIVPLPMAVEQYRQDFDPASQQEFDALLARASEVFVVDAPDASRGACYREAGLTIARQSHLLLALWDGVPYLSPEGGGTYETIQFAQQTACVVCAVPTPRPAAPDVQPPAHIDVPANASWAWMDAYNHDVARNRSVIEQQAASNAPHYIGAEDVRRLPADTAKLLWASLHADALSVRFRDASLRVLRALSTFGLLLVLAFLLYDELESDALLIVYAGILSSAVLVYALSMKRKLHAKYVRYRTWAEALRVQFYWRTGGVSDDVCDQYTFTQQSELAFVRCFLRAMDGGKPAPVQTDCQSEGLCRYWAQEQQDYHSASETRKVAQYRTNQRATRLFFALSILLFLVVCAGEAFWKPALETVLPLSRLRSALLPHGGQEILWRNIAKIALGIISAATAFLANYYGNLALPKQILDNQRMRALFAATPLEQKTGAQFQDALRLLGRESLIESASWYIAQRELSPGLKIG